MDTAAPRPRPACSRSSPREHAGKLGEGQTATPPSCSAAPRSSTTTRRSRWSSPRPSSRRAPPPQLIRVEYAPAAGPFDLRRAANARPTRADSGEGSAARRRTASATSSGAFAAAPVKLDATYTTPDQSHAMMEPHATIAAWEGDKLTVWTSNQMIDLGQARSGRDARHARRRTSG